MNSHGIADFAHELQAVCADQLPACILSQTGLAVPVPPGLVLPAFSTEGYVRETDTLVYVNQDAHTVTLTGADGTFWLALATDTWTAYAQWTTEAGTHYRWRPSATQPADVAGLLVMASVTVAGGAVTAVTPLPTVTRAAAGRALLGLGTMAEQDADAVAITGGDVEAARVGVQADISGDALGTLRVGASALVAGNLVAAGDVTAARVGVNADISGDALGTLRVGASATIGGNAAVQGELAVTGSAGFHRAAEASAALTVQVTKAGLYGIFFRQDADTGTALTQVFHNAAGTMVGSINSTATATTYSTSSDRRLKDAVEPLTGALDVIRALRPITHLWRADGSRGYAFLANEVEQVVDGVVTGEPDAVDDRGNIVPQMIDMSRLMPWAIAGLKDLLTLVEKLQARVTTLEPNQGNKHPDPLAHRGLSGPGGAGADADGPAGGA